MCHRPPLRDGIKMRPRLTPQSLINFVFGYFLHSLFIAYRPHLLVQHAVPPSCGSSLARRRGLRELRPHYRGRQPERADDLHSQRRGKCWHRYESLLGF